MIKPAPHKYRYICNTVIDAERKRKGLEWIVLRDEHPIGKFKTRREARAAVRREKFDEFVRRTPE